MASGDIFNNPDINDEDFFTALGQAYQKHIDDLKGTFVINPPQYQKFLEAATYFKSLVKEFGGKVRDCSLEPKERNGWFEVSISTLDLNKDGLKSFAEILQKVDVFSVDSSADGRLIIDIYVNNVFEQVDK